MRLSSHFAAGLVVLAVDQTLVSARQSQPPDTPCNVTIADGPATWYGNELLSVAGLRGNGTIVFRPGGPGFVTSTGALGMKFGWMRRARGRLQATGRRLDGAAAPLQLEVHHTSRDIGFQASYLIFPTPGCWEVTAQVTGHDDSRMTFVTRVVKIGTALQGDMIRPVDDSIGAAYP
jgi:hypothetical protein